MVSNKILTGHKEMSVVQPDEKVVVSGIGLYEWHWAIVNNNAVRLASGGKPNASESIRQIIYEWYQANKDKLPELALETIAA
jgi:hypothetical protein